MAIPPGSTVLTIVAPGFGGTVWTNVPVTAGPRGAMLLRTPTREGTVTDFEVVEVAPIAAAAVQAEVPMSELRGFFDRGFGMVIEAITKQGLRPAGPPFGFYPSMPGETVAVAVGFPVSGTFVADGEVVPFELPGGRVIRGVHVGPYEDLQRTYGELLAFAGAQGLELATGMWETYLSDPSAEPDPSTWRTEVTWPVR
jgi:effector-binding domain-containing protein